MHRSTDERRDCRDRLHSGERGTIESILNDNLKESLIGENPLDVKRLWYHMFHGWQARHGRGNEGGLAVNAMAAIDMALWDIAGKAAGLPLCRLLGGGPLKSKLMAYASPTGFEVESLRKDRRKWRAKSADVLASEAKLFVKQGFKAIKFSWGIDFGAEAEERLFAIREAIGPHIRLMVDVGSPDYWDDSWNVRAAVRAARILEKYNIFFMEEPLPPGDSDGHAAVTRASETNVASGESLSTARQFFEFINKRAVDIVQPDAAQMGITQMLQVVHAAETAGLMCIPHSPWGAQIVAAHVLIMSTFSNGPMIEYPAFESYAEETRAPTYLSHVKIIEKPLTLEDGYNIVPETPGLGLGNYVDQLS